MWYLFQCAVVGGVVFSVVWIWFKIKVAMGWKI